MKFNDSNYLTWSKSILIYIQGKDKLEYLTREKEMSSQSESSYRKWKTENAIIKGWLLNSMTPEISEHYLFLETTHQIWDALAKSYSEMGHTTKIFELTQKIVHFKQGDQPLTLHYSSLRKTWGELYHYTTFCYAYVKDTVEYKKHVESILIFEFLARMNPDYETGEGSYFLEGPSAILN